MDIVIHGEEVVVAMVHITAEAAEVFDAMRADALEQLDTTPEELPEYGLRIMVDAEKAGLFLDMAGEEDQVVELDGHTVLLISPDVGTVLDGLTIDVADTDDGRRLVVEKR